ncbi:MAG: LysR family transcriptional regulator, partial [Sphingobium sp.]
PASLRDLARTGVRYVTIAGDTPELETGLAWRNADQAPTLLAMIELASSLGTQALGDDA